MMQVTAELSQADVDKLLGMFQISKEAARRAAKRAVTKTAKWTQGTAARAMSAELRIQQSVLRQRLRMYRKGEGLEQKVWLGLNALAARRLGIPRKVSGGTSVGQHFFPGAFPIAKYNNGVYRRTGKGRFPLELARLEIDAAGERAMRAAATETEARFMHILQQELRYEFSKVFKGAVK